VWKENILYFNVASEEKVDDSTMTVSIMATPEKRRREDLIYNSFLNSQLLKSSLCKELSFLE
jgi:hypothetical protein